MISVLRTHCNTNRQFKVINESTSLAKALGESQRDFRTQGRYVIVDTARKEPHDTVIYDSADPEFTLSKMIGSLSDVTFDRRARFVAR